LNFGADYRLKLKLDTWCLVTARRLMPQSGTTLKRRRNDDFIRFESWRFGGRSLDRLHGAVSGGRCATEFVSARFLL
jgi:hypothetical protein